MENVDTVPMNTAELVDAAVKHYGDIAPVEPGQEGEPEAPIVPNPLGYALGWIVANAIVTNRYLDSAIDALPISHPESGWDRILLTRRVSCKMCEGETANAFGTIMLTGEDAPILHTPGKDDLALGAALRDDPEGAIQQVLERYPFWGIPEGEHHECWHTLAELYPTIYDAITQIIVDNPGVTAMREIYVDDEQYEGVFHPIYLMTGGNIKGLDYGWCALESPDYTTFFRINGRNSIYQTNEGNWSTVVKQLVDEERDGVLKRLKSWLRIEGEPDRANID